MSHSVLPTGDIERLRDHILEAEFRMYFLDDDGQEQSKTLGAIEETFGECPARDPQLAFQKKNIRFNASSIPLTFATLNVEREKDKIKLIVTESQSHSSCGSGKSSGSGVQVALGGGGGGGDSVSMAWAAAGSASVGRKQSKASVSDSSEIHTLFLHMHKELDHLKELKGAQLQLAVASAKEHAETAESVWTCISGVQQSLATLQNFLLPANGQRKMPGGRFAWDSLHLLDSVLLCDTLKEPVAWFC